MKTKAEIEEENRKAQEMRFEQDLKALMQSRQTLAKPAVDVENNEEELQDLGKPVTLEAVNSDSKSDDYQKFIKDFEAEFGKEKHTNGRLEFPSEERAHIFLTKQAELGRKFLGKWIDPTTGKPTGNYEFSCGDRKLYSGTLESIHAQMKANLGKSPENDALIQAGLAEIEAHMPTNKSKSLKDDLKAATQEGKEPEAEPTAPNPFRTSPTPT